MPDPTELAEAAAAFGVSDDQVRRDHLISHLLAALSQAVRTDVVFFGGTALSRTHLPDGRLSEDLGLLAVGSRRPVAATVEVPGRLTTSPTSRSGCAPAGRSCGSHGEHRPARCRSEPTQK